MSWDSFVRRYNADLANDFGNLVNRTVSMTNRYLDGERPAPRRGRGFAARPCSGRRPEPRIASGSRASSCTRRWPSCGTFVGAANKAVDAEQPWVLAKAAKAGDEAAEARLRDVLGDLIEACRLVGLAAAPFLPATAPRLLAQLGHAYPYGPDGNGGPPILDELGWGAHAGQTGRVSDPEPLFPRLDIETRGVLTAAGAGTVLARPRPTQ